MGSQLRAELQPRPLAGPGNSPLRNCSRIAAARPSVSRAMSKSGFETGIAAFIASSHSSRRARMSSAFAGSAAARSFFSPAIRRQTVELHRTVLIPPDQLPLAHPNSRAGSAALVRIMRIMPEKRFARGRGRPRQNVGTRSTPSRGDPMKRPTPAIRAIVG